MTRHVAECFSLADGYGSRQAVERRQAHVHDDDIRTLAARHLHGLIGTPLGFSEELRLPAEQQRDY